MDENRGDGEKDRLVPVLLALQREEYEKALKGCEVVAPAREISRRQQDRRVCGEIRPRRRAASIGFDFL
jgi:hypothetical protein